MRRLLLALLLLLPRAAHADEVSEAHTDVRLPSKDDLFPGAGRATVAAATGLPFLGIAEIGIGITDGFAVGAVGGITPSVVTAGIRPRARVATGSRTAFELVMPMLYYPKASAPGPGNLGTTSWVLARPELFWGGSLDAAERWTLMGGMGVVAAASTEAIDETLHGREFKMPPYDGSPDSKRGFAGGIWNTAGARGSFRFAKDSRFFAEAGVVLKGVVPADDVGGPPIVVTLGVQHTF
jgi:hypothetical protein